MTFLALHSLIETSYIRQKINKIDFSKQFALFNIFEKNIYNVIKTNLSRIYSSGVWKIAQNILMLCTF